MLHLDTARLARVQRDRDLNTDRWQRLITVCQQYLPLTEPWGVGHAQNFALAGLISGNTGYKAKAIALAMMHCERGYEAISPERTGYGHWGGVREIAPAVACVYDWLYADLTSQQRATMESWLINWARLCWPETQPSDKRDLWARSPAHPGDNFYAGFMYASMAAGLAVSSRKGGFATQANWILNLTMGRWRVELLPHKARYEPDGFPLEGSSYGVQAWTNLLLAKDAWQTVKGEDLWADSSRLINQYLLHITTPDMRRLTLWGDNAVWTPGKGVNLMPINDYAKLPAWVAQNHVPAMGSPTSFAWWLANVNPMPPGGPDIEFVEHLPAGVRKHSGYIFDPPESAAGAFFTPPSPFHWLAWAPVLFARAELSETGAGAKKPLASAGNGFAIACQPGQTLIPDRDSTQLSLIAGPLLESHQDKAPGAVQIYKDGEMLIGGARHWSYLPGLGRDTIHHSTLLLPPHHVSEPAWQADVPEPLMRAHESIRITRSVSDERYLYLEAELAGAYAFVGPWNADAEQWVRHPLKRWTRRILWHRAHDLFLFIDEVEKEPWAQQPVIAWQVRDRLALNGVDGWQARAGDWLIAGTALQPVATPGVEAVADSFRVVVPMPQGTYSVLVQALQIRFAAAGQSRIPKRFERGGALGVTFGSGAEAVTLAVQMGAAPPTPPQKRVYHLDSQEFKNWESYAEELKTLLNGPLGEFLHSVRSSMTDTGGGDPRPTGEFILIPRSGA